jgi:hypothetical protein
MRLFAHLLQQFVADRMPERGVDMLEAIQVAVATTLRKYFPYGAPHSAHI